MSGQITIAPRLIRRTELTSLSLTGAITRREYFRLYEGETFASAQLSSSARLSERLTFFGSAAYTRNRASNNFGNFVGGIDDVVGGIDDVAGGIDDVAGGINDVVGGIDDVAGAIDPRGIGISKSANLGGTYAVSTRTSISAGARVGRNDFNNSDLLVGYDTFGGNLSYTRVMSERLSLGASARTSFQAFDIGSETRIMMLAGTASYRLSPRMSLSGSAGLERVSFGRDAAAGGPRSSSLQFGADANLCRTAERMSMCLNAALQAAPTALGEVQRQLSAGAFFNYRPGERMTYAASASYVRSSALESDGLLPTLSFASVRASASRRLREALSLSAYVQYRRRSGLRSADSVAVGADIRWTWGKTDGRI